MEPGDVQVNGLRLHYVTEGAGDLVLLLHGFPETHHTWRKQIPALAARFRVVAPDLRGYGESDKPPRISDYRVEAVADDIAALIGKLGAERAHVVGHDWGGGVAWALAQRSPAVLDKLAVLNCPHPAVMWKALRSNWRQVRRSWYILAAQVPWLPERLLLRDGARAIGGALRGSARTPDTFTDVDLAEYERAFARPGAATAALNYYRAAFRSGLRGAPSSRPIAAPTLLIWGEDDFALGKELTYGMEGLFADGFRIEYVPGASHWVNEERPDLVNRLLLDFL